MRIRTLVTGALLGAAVAVSQLIPGTALAGTFNTYTNLATGFCLDSNGQGRVYTLGCNGGSFQKWILHRVDGGYTLRNLATGFCLDSNTEGRAYTLGCNGGNYQVWQREVHGSQRTWRNLSTGFCLDSNTDGKVYTLGCNGGSYQRWTPASGTY
ncbi:RICIN domain-containing protein [Cryptosporangium phraense]|uniref:Ricin-type beta-trefoil lectin domain protein n=1 Tax=Cryptosporangium phraense TaxID=2593070 RepID=A0A545ARQ0_9ACTN|nr:RICIN domain-containing protein [Cryptosporangium phraense]TQS44010.1 ricin-type beta-trefoil lectin domain protein [Cryptosporangium phraense]